MAEIITSVDSEDSEYAISFLTSLYEDLDTVQAKIDDVSIFHGSRGDYAQELTESCNDVPEYLMYYINYDAMVRGMEINGKINEVDHDVFIINAQYF
jgi:hypothetical protein